MAHIRSALLSIHDFPEELRFLFALASGWVKAFLKDLHFHVGEIPDTVVKEKFFLEVYRPVVTSYKHTLCSTLCTYSQSGYHKVCYT